jgi:methanogenic corrinoid protein MtbC1
MIDLNEALFDKIFSTSLLRLDFENTISEVVFPFLNKTGLMWQTGAINPAQEHFISNLIRQKLILAIESIPKNQQKNDLKAILFLPENELHENSLLLYHYILKAKGYQTYYFGQTLPVNDLNRIIEISKVNLIVSVITCDMPKNKLTSFYQQLEKLPNNITIALSGRVVMENQHDLLPRFTFFKDATALKNLIATSI